MMADPLPKTTTLTLACVRADKYDRQLPCILCGHVGGTVWRPELAIKYNLDGRRVTVALHESCRRNVEFSK